MAEENNEKIKEIAEKHNLKMLLLFGSRADGSFREDSDYDIAYMTNDNKELGFDGDFYSDLISYLGSENIHVLNLKKIKPLTFYEVMRNCKVLYAKNMMDFYNLRAAAFRRFEDEVKPLYQIIFNKLKAEYLVK